MTKKKLTKSEAKSKIWIVYWLTILSIVVICSIIFANNYCNSNALIEQLWNVCNR